MYTKLNHKSSALPLLFENLKCETYTLNYLSHSITSSLTEESWVNIDDTMMTSSGHIQFDIRKIVHLDKIDYALAKTIHLFFENGSTLSLDLQAEQTETASYILKSLEEDATHEKFIPHTASPPCPCCQKQAEKVRLKTESHPIAMMLDYARRAKLTLQCEITNCGVSSNHLSKLETLNFHKGIATLQGLALIDLDLAFIHSAHLSKQTIDEQPYTKLLAFNPHGLLSFSIAAEGTSVFQTWKTMLESNWNLQTN